MTNFDSDLVDVENVLVELTSDNFVVVTTKEGGRGIDMKGNSKAHVIIAFESKNYAQIIQALGRGCRNIDSFAEGTIIARDVAHTNKDQYLRSLQSKQYEYGMALRINCKIARLLHMREYQRNLDLEEKLKLAEKGQLPEDRREHVTLVLFQGVMSRNENLSRIAQGNMIWQALRELHDQIPKDCHQ